MEFPSSASHFTGLRWSRAQCSFNAFTFAQSTHAPLTLLSPSPVDEDGDEEEKDGDVEDEDDVIIGRMMMFNDEEAIDPCPTEPVVALSSRGGGGW